MRNPLAYLFDEPEFAAKEPLDGPTRSQYQAPDGFTIQTGIRSSMVGIAGNDERNVRVYMYTRPVKP